MKSKPVGVFATLTPPSASCPYGGTCFFQQESMAVPADMYGQICERCDVYYEDERPRFQMVAPSYRVAALTCNRFLALCSESGVDTSGYVFKVAALDE